MGVRKRLLLVVFNGTQPLNFLTIEPFDFFLDFKSQKKLLRIIYP